MTVEMTTIGNHAVFRDHLLTHRWYDAFGPRAAKYVTSFTSLPADDATTLPTEFVCTLVGASTAVINDTAGGALIVTTAAGGTDGVSMQLGNANLGEWCSFAGKYPTYFGIEFAVNDVDQTAVLFGTAVTDTALIAAVTDGMYFRSVDETAVLNFVLEKDSLETVTAVATLADSTYVTAEWLYWGSYVYVYIDGVLTATIADTDVRFPNDELLRLSLEVISGEAVANTCNIKWVRLIQIQE